MGEMAFSDRDVLRLMRRIHSYVSGKIDNFFQKTLIGN